MLLSITNRAQYDALVDALEQFNQNERIHLEECDEEGEHDAAAWAKLEAAEAYAEQLAVALCQAVERGDSLTEGP